MQLYGCAIDDPEKLTELSEVSFVADPDELRRIANFLIYQAEYFVKGGGNDHAHFSDYIDDESIKYEIIVCNPKYSGDH